MPSPIGPPPPGPTMSASTAPASIEASWPGSPTSTRRAPGRMAATSRAISDSDTIDVSSTTTTSWGRSEPRRPSSRCSVEAPRSRRSARVACVGRDVGVVHRLGEPGGGLAGRRREGDSGAGRPAAAACSASSAMMRATVVVLPVPGPPATTASPRRTAAAAASRCRVGPANIRSSPGRQQRLVHGRGRGAGQRAQVSGHALLLAPVAVEVDRAAGQAQRTRRERARRHRAASPPVRATAGRPGRPARRRRPSRWPRSSPGRRSMAVARPAHRERGGERDRLVRLPSWRRRRATWTSAAERRPRR